MKRDELIKKINKIATGYLNEVGIEFDNNDPHDDAITKRCADFILAREKEQIAKVVEPLREYVDFYKKHCSYEEEKTRRLQEASNMAREGKQTEAKRIVQGYDNAGRVFDYSKVNKGLIKALSIADEIMKEDEK